MAGEDKTILEYDDFSSGAPILLGRLYVVVIKGGESYSFEYDKEWLKNNKLSINLDPELQPFVGTFGDGVRGSNKLLLQCFAANNLIRYRKRL